MILTLGQTRLVFTLERVQPRQIATTDQASPIQHISLSPEQSHIAGRSRVEQFSGRADNGVEVEALYRHENSLREISREQERLRVQHLLEGRRL